MSFRVNRGGRRAGLAAATLLTVAGLAGCAAQPGYQTPTSSLGGVGIGTGAGAGAGDRRWVPVIVGAFLTLNASVAATLTHPVRPARPATPSVVSSASGT